MNNLRANPALSTSGSYAGNDAANRPIPHGLGRIPSAVLLHQSGTQVAFLINSGSAEIVMIGNAVLAVTGMDSTNFYVGNVANFGNSANASGADYYWGAF